MIAVTVDNAFNGGFDDVDDDVFFTTNDLDEADELRSTMTEVSDEPLQFGFSR